MLELNVHLVMVLWKNVTSFAFDKEVDARHFIIVCENVLVLVLDNRFQSGAYPCDEHHRSVFQEVDTIDETAIQKQRHCHFQILW